MDTQTLERTTPVDMHRRPRRFIGWLLIALGVIVPVLVLLVHRFMVERGPVLAQRIVDVAPVWGALALMMIAVGMVLLRVGRRGIALVAVLALVWLTATIVSRPFAPSQTVTSPAGDLALRVRPLPLGATGDREVSLEQRRGAWSDRIVLGCLTQQQHITIEWLNDDEVRLTLLQNGNPMGPAVTYQPLYGARMMAGLSSPDAALQRC